MKTFSISKLNIKTSNGGKSSSFFPGKCIPFSVVFVFLLTAASAQLFGQQEQRLRSGGFGSNRYFPSSGSSQGDGDGGHPHRSGGGPPGFPGRNPKAARGGPFKLGPFSALGHGGGGDEDDDDSFGIEETSLRQKKIVMFDIFNLYQPFATLIKAIFQLFCRLWTRMELFGLSLLNKGDPPPDRMSTIIVSWIVFATFTILIGLCIKRICSNFDHLREIRDFDPSIDEGRPPESETAAVGGGKDGEDSQQQHLNDVAQNKQNKNAKKTSLRKRKPSTKKKSNSSSRAAAEQLPPKTSRRVIKKREPLHSCLQQLESDKFGFETRWIDLILKNLFDPKKCHIWNRVREAWIRKLNQHTKMLAEKVRQFCRL